MAYIQEKQQVTTVKEVITGYKCDICGNKSEGKDLPKDWVELTHGHGDWGNDSFESYETFQLCSPACYLKQVAKSSKALVDYRSAEIKTEMTIPFSKRLLAYTAELLK